MRPKLYIARNAVKYSGEKQTRIMLFLGSIPRMQAGIWIGAGRLGVHALSIGGIDVKTLELMAGRAVKNGEIMLIPISKAVSIGVFKHNAGVKK